MKVFVFTPPRYIAAILLCGAFIFGLWYFQAPPTVSVTNPALPVAAVPPRQSSPPVSQAHTVAEPSKLASPEGISSRAAEKVKAYADVRRKLRSGEITTLPADLAPPPLPASIETPDTNP